MITDIGKWNTRFDFSARDYQNKALSEKNLSLVYELNWFKCFLPKTLNGMEFQLWDGLTVIRKASGINGSLGWLVNLGGGANFFWHYFEDEKSAEIFSPRETVLAGSGRLGVLEKNRDGLYLSGTWANCSGSAHATHFTVSAAASSGDTQSFLVEREKVSIKKYWPFDALQASSSHQISIDALKVSEDSMFKIDQSKTKLDYPLRFLSFSNFAQLSMLMSVLGMYEGLLYRIKEEKPTVFDRLGGDMLYEDFTERLKQLEKVSTEIWTACKLASDLVERDLDSIIQESVLFIEGACSNVIRTMGMELWRKDSLIHLSWKDLMLALQHGMLKVKS